MVSSIPETKRSALSPAQAKILDFIRGFAAGNTIPPSIRDVATRFGIKPPTALFHLRALERKGYIRRKPGKARAIEIVRPGRSLHERRGALENARGASAHRGIPIVGRVAAGAPILAVENIEGSLSFDAESSGGPGERVFALKVQGESMIEDGILDGDLAIVREQPAASPGDIVVVLVGEGDGVEATLKRYHPDLAHGRVVLRPANRAMEPIVIEGRDLETLRIVGKVVGVVRWLR